MTRETSRHAYTQAVRRLPAREADHVRWLLAHDGEGATDDEFRRIFGATSANQWAPARSALTAAGMLIDSGQRRYTELGRPAIVWVLAGHPYRAETLWWHGCTAMGGRHTLDVVTRTCRRCHAPLQVARQAPTVAPVAEQAAFEL